MLKEIGKEYEEKKNNKKPNFHKVKNNTQTYNNKHETIQTQIKLKKPIKNPVIKKIINEDQKYLNQKRYKPNNSKNITSKRLNTDINDKLNKTQINKKSISILEKENNKILLNNSIKNDNQNNNKGIEKEIVNKINNINNSRLNYTQRNRIKTKALSIDKRILFNKLNNKKINESSIIKTEKLLEKDNNEINSVNYLCFQCQEKAFIELNLNNLSININCENGHLMKNIPIQEFRDKNNLNKRTICFNCRNKNIKPKNLYYCSCGKNICLKCKKIHKDHSQIQISEKYYYCNKHKKKYTCFCKTCNKNICNDCLHEHSEHNKDILYFENVLPTNRDFEIIRDNFEKMKEQLIYFNDKVNKFFEKLKEKKKIFNQNYNQFMLLMNDIINNMNNKENINYENIYNFNNVKLNSIKNENNIINQFLNIENNFVKEGKFLIELLGGKTFDNNEIVKDEIINNQKYENKLNNKLIENQICNENNFNIFNKNINNNSNITYQNNNINNVNNNINLLKQLFDDEDINVKENNQDKVNNINANQLNINNNINPNNSNETNKNEIINIIDNKKENEDALKQIEKKTLEISTEVNVLEKIENCELKLQQKDEACITSFAILRNNRILITFKGGKIKIYEFEKKNNNIPLDDQNEIQLKEILRLEEEEYCFNYGIELKNGNVAICSEDGTVKIIKLFFDEKSENNINEKYKLIQKIVDKEQDPIYIIKELENENIVLGCWRNILLYQKADEYELLNKIFIGDYTFSILELSPNEIISSHSETKTLLINDLNNYESEKIENIESNENNNIICKYDNKNEIVFVAYDNGINIVSVIEKCLIKKIELNEIISSLCPIMVNISIGENQNEKVFGLLCGAKRRIYNNRVNYAYSLFQLGFNINNKDKGVITTNKNIEWKKISRKDFIHFYDITNIKNSIFCKNNNTLKINENKGEQWIFSSGNEDKLLKIWKF